MFVTSLSLKYHLSLSRTITLLTRNSNLTVREIDLLFFIDNMGVSYSLSYQLFPPTCNYALLVSSNNCTYTPTMNNCIDKALLSFVQYFPFVSELLFLFLSIDLEPPTCNDGDVRLQSKYNNSLRYDDIFVMQINGNLEICYNRTFHGLCTSGNYNFQQTAELACLSFGYTSE